MFHLVNKLHIIRNYLFQDMIFTKMLNMKYNFASYIGLWRGRMYKLLGRVKLENKNRELIVGPRVDFHQEPGSAILLATPPDLPIDKYPVNARYPEATFIAMRNHPRFTNHSEYRETRIRLMKKSKLIFEPNSKICIGSYVSIWPEKEMYIGAGTTIGNGVVLNTRCGLNIGRNVLIAREAIIMDYDGHPIFNSTNPENDEENTYGGSGEQITIESDVWIGFRAMIMKGVKIGRGSIVGAYACVYKDVPANCIVAGNPAKIIKEGISWRKY